MASFPRVGKGTSPRELDLAKRGNVLQVLLKCARLVNEEAMSRVNEDAQRRLLRPAVTNLLPHIAFEGTRLGEIANKLGVTKQAVSKLVAELEEEGFLELTPDREDRRGKLVRFTPLGRAAIRHGLGVLSGLEAELAQVLGQSRLTELLGTLTTIVSKLEHPGNSTTAVKTQR